ncbi:MAG: ornithine carbamoyltransferase [Burkholderiales bacterium]|jgi:ornithine carbamoyltransferase|nr:ornithine carbamoyltransferase [Burkholderiales bacterium]
MTAPKHFLTFADLSRQDITYLFSRARLLKERVYAGQYANTLKGKTLAMIFEKASTRTRVSFEIGIMQLGGNAVVLSGNDTQIARGEPVPDTARVISSMADGVMIRTFHQKMVETFAEYSRVPVINGLTDEHHPCQVLTDLYTFFEHRGSIAGKTVTWIGDANNMLYSWIQAAAVMDFAVRYAAPEGYRVDMSRLSEKEKTHLEFCADPADAMKNAALVSTDVWVSMGQEAENAKRRRAFEGFQVTGELMGHAAPNAVFMHCLPAHRGEEVTAEVIDGGQSLVWAEAENRLHAQKALIEFLLLGVVKTD